MRKLILIRCANHFVFYSNYRKMTECGLFGAPKRQGVSFVRRVVWDKAVKKLKQEKLESD